MRARLVLLGIALLSSVLAVSAVSSGLTASTGDAGVKRLATPRSVRLLPGVPDTTGAASAIVVNSISGQADNVGLYVALLPPGGTSNPGLCSPAAVIDLGIFNLLPGAKISVPIDPSWVCANPAAIDGQNWTMKAVADVNGDDFASCATLAQVFDTACSLAVNDDDDNDADNTLTRALPLVVALSP